MNFHPEIPTPKISGLPHYIKDNFFKDENNVQKLNNFTKQSKIEQENWNSKNNINDVKSNVLPKSESFILQNNINNNNIAFGYNNEDLSNANNQKQQFSQKYKGYISPKFQRQDSKNPRDNSFNNLKNDYNNVIKNLSQNNSENKIPQATQYNINNGSNRKPYISKYNNIDLNQFKDFSQSPLNRKQQNTENNGIFNPFKEIANNINKYQKSGQKQEYLLQQQQKQASGAKNDDLENKIQMYKQEKMSKSPIKNSSFLEENQQGKLSFRGQQQQQYQQQQKLQQQQYANFQIKQQEIQNSSAKKNQNIQQKNQIDFKGNEENRQHKGTYYYQLLQEKLNHIQQDDEQKSASKIEAKAQFQNFLQQQLASHTPKRNQGQNIDTIGQNYFKSNNKNDISAKKLNGLNNQTYFISPHSKRNNDQSPYLNNKYLNLNTDIPNQDKSVGSFLNNNNTKKNDQKDSFIFLPNNYTNKNIINNRYSPMNQKSKCQKILFNENSALHQNNINNNEAGSPFSVVKKQNYTNNNYNNNLQKQESMENNNNSSNLSKYSNFQQELEKQQQQQQQYLNLQKNYSDNTGRQKDAFSPSYFKQQSANNINDNNLAQNQLQNLNKLNEISSKNELSEIQKKFETILNQKKLHLQQENVINSPKIQADDIIQPQKQNLDQKTIQSELDQTQKDPQFQKQHQKQVQQLQFLDDDECQKYGAKLLLQNQCHTTRGMSPFNNNNGPATTRNLSSKNLPRTPNNNHKNGQLKQFFLGGYTNVEQKQKNMNIVNNNFMFQNMDQPSNCELQGNSHSIKKQINKTFTSNKSNKNILDHSNQNINKNQNSGLNVDYSISPYNKYKKQLQWDDIAQKNSKNQLIQNQNNISNNNNINNDYNNLFRNRAISQGGTNNQQQQQQQQYKLNLYQQQKEILLLKQQKQQEYNENQLKQLQNHLAKTPSKTEDRNQVDLQNNQQERQLKQQQQQDQCRTPTKQLDYRAEISNDNNLENYQMGKILGLGSYAIVKLAQHKSGIQVAIKSYDKAKLQDYQKRKNVQREIRILSKLRHKNIVKLYNVIEGKTQLHLIQQYSSTKPLSHLLKAQSNKRISDSMGKIVFRQIVDAIQYIHRKGVVHRDIKLENILIENHPSTLIRLIDFGFSIAIAPTAKINIFCGTPSYMAPEIVNKQDYSFPVDIWALGILLYKLLTGNFPFRGKDDKELYRRINSCQMEWPSFVTPQAKNLLINILQKNPNQRYTAEQILQDEWLQQDQDQQQYL